MTKQLLDMEMLKNDIKMRLASEQSLGQFMLASELKRLRIALLLSAILIFGGLVAVVVAITGADWFYPSIFFIVISYIAWARLAF